MGGKKKRSAKILVKPPEVAAAEHLAHVLADAGSSANVLVTACEAISASVASKSSPATVQLLIDALGRSLPSRSLSGDHLRGSQPLAAAALKAVSSLLPALDMQLPASVWMRLLHGSTEGIAAFSSSVTVLISACAIINRGCEFLDESGLGASVPSYVVHAALLAVVSLHRQGVPLAMLTRGLQAANAAVGDLLGSWCPGELCIPDGILAAFFDVIGSVVDPEQAGAEDHIRRPGIIACEAALETLAALVHAEPAFRVHAAEEGAAAAVVQAIAADGDNEDVFGAGLQCLNGLLLSSYNRTGAQLLAGGAAEAAAALLCRYGEDDEDITEAACSVLALLSWNRSERVRDDFAARARRCGVPALLEAALQRDGRDVAYSVAVAQDLLCRPDPGAMGVAGEHRAFVVVPGTAENQRSSGRLPRVVYVDGSGDDVEILLPQDCLRGNSDEWRSQHVGQGASQTNVIWGEEADGIRGATFSLSAEQARSLPIAHMDLCLHARSSDPKPRPFSSPPHLSHPVILRAQKQAIHRGVASFTTSFGASGPSLADAQFEAFAVPLG